MDELIVTLDFLTFPPSLTCDGSNISPHIRLKGISTRAASVAVMVFNPFEKFCCSFTPWLCWNIPPMPVIRKDFRAGPRVSGPVPAGQGITDYGITGYTGPCPPPGGDVRYQFKIYVLDTLLDIPAGSDKHTLIAAMKGHVIQFGETVAIASR